MSLPLFFMNLTLINLWASFLILVETINGFKGLGNILSEEIFLKSSSAEQSGL